MRLTLRTLLAYLDDVLEPADSRAISDQINASPAASELVGKTRDVIRRRRLSAPAVSGAGMGVDPNAVAEYLDSNLSPEGVADVERICLDSEMHLAEVAACHQILTLLMGEPVDVTPAMRERMYGLGPVATPLRSPGSSHGSARIGAQPAVAHSPTPPSALGTPTQRDAAGFAAAPAASNGVPAAVAAPAHSPKPPPFQQGLPDYLREPPLWKTPFAYWSVVAVLVLIWGWAMIYFFQSTPPMVADNNGKAETDVKVAANTPKKTGQSDAELAGIPVKKPETEKPAEDASAKPSVVGIDPPPPADMPEEPKEATEVATVEGSKPPKTLPAETPRKMPIEGGTEPKVVPMPPPTTGTPDGSGDTAATPKKPVEPMPDTPPKKTTEVAVVTPGGKPVTMGAEIGTYRSFDGLVMVFAPAQQHWYPLARRTMIRAGDVLAVPEPFEGLFEFDQGKGTVRLLDGTLAGVMGENPVAATGWELDRGRMVMKLTAGASRKPFALKVRQTIWSVELLSDDTVIGVEVVPRVPQALEEDLTGREFAGAIFVETGSVRVIAPDKTAQTVMAANWYPLTAETQVSGNPKWLGESTLSKIQRQQAKVFEDLLVDPMATSRTAIDLIAPGVASDRRPQLARLAVATLDLMGAYVPLLDALKSETGHEESRLMAIHGLQLWLPRQPENRDLLRDELAKRFQPADVDVMYRLLWGFNENDAKDNDASKKLVEWLGHGEISIRELAFYHVLALTGNSKRYDYRPNASPAQRESALKSWRNHIKNGTLVAP